MKDLDVNGGKKQSGAKYICFFYQTKLKKKL